MFYSQQNQQDKDEYLELLSTIGSLSNMFSDSEIPYLYYRAVENVFCIAFRADNLSRSDCSVDAVKNGVGIGIKTFLNGNGRTLQKIAEFNSDRELYNRKAIASMVRTIARLRNERLRSTRRIYNLENLLYHCVVREARCIKIFETRMHEINIDNIIITSTGGNTIAFNDGIEEYSFNSSKSTLYKRFHTREIQDECLVRIMENPYAVMRASNAIAYAPERTILGRNLRVVLPLYSITAQQQKVVSRRSGLNQWNAKGRTRHPNEMYIPIPREVHRKVPGFFPCEKESFLLRLPNGQKLSAKVCQEQDKALMSNPNRDLGAWLRETAMGIPAGELMTYERLAELGFDAVLIQRIGEYEYSIDIAPIGSYERFLEDLTE